MPGSGRYGSNFLEGHIHQKGQLGTSESFVISLDVFWLGCSLEPANEFLFLDFVDDSYVFCANWRNV